MGPTQGVLRNSPLGITQVKALLNNETHLVSGKTGICAHMNQYTVSPVRWDTYFQANRVEHQKLNQTTAELSFG